MSGKNYRFYAIVGVTVVALLAGVVVVRTQNGTAVAGLNAPGEVQAGAAPVAPPAEASNLGMITVQELKHDSAPSLREMKVLPAPNMPRPKVQFNPPLPAFGHVDQADPVVQSSVENAVNVSAPLNVFEGINQAGGCGNCAPPDTNGDVGPNYYVQTVNSSFAIWDKAGNKLYGPAAINTIWQGFGGPCETRNDGDPIVLYDGIADRWLISQFTAASPYNECIAISKTSDPVNGGWWRYAFALSTRDFPDYPKFGVWPDGYYMSVNWFKNGATYGGPRPYAFDRAKMLNGQTATAQTTSAALGSTVAPIMPADLDGPTQPAAGSPEVFIGVGSTMKMYKMTINWANPASSTWVNFANVIPSAYTGAVTVPQPGTSTKLDGLGDRLMTRVVYRNMGTYQSLLATQNVSASGADGIRWYEIRNPLGAPSIYQQGTYAPDSTYRWMGSIAMNGKGEIALGYSASSSSVYPSIRYTGRLATDPLGAMQAEATMYAGTGSQSGVSRWGDYSNLAVDPADDCTFIFTTEYNNSFGWAWGTKFGSFRVSTCP